MNEWMNEWMNVHVQIKKIKGFANEQPGWDIWLSAKGFHTSCPNKLTCDWDENPFGILVSDLWQVSVVNLWTNILNI